MYLECFFEERLLFPLRFFSRINAVGDVLNHFKMKPQYQMVPCPVMLNQKKLEWSFISNVYALEMKSSWKLPVAWPSEEGQNMYWFLFCPKNCMSCVRLRERREGKPLQVKQLFRDEIIVWLHLFTPMAQRGSAKQHNCLCYLIAASTPSYKDIFSGSSAEGHFVQPFWLCHWATIQVIGCEKIHFERVSWRKHMMYVCVENSSVAHR